MKIPKMNLILIISFIVLGAMILVTAIPIKNMGNEEGVIACTVTGLIFIIAGVFTWFVSKKIADAETKVSNNTMTKVHKDTTNWHETKDEMARHAMMNKTYRKGQTIKKVYVLDNPWITIPVTVMIHVLFIGVGCFIFSESPMFGLYAIGMVIVSFVYQLKKLPNALKEYKEKHKDKDTTKKTKNKRQEI